MDPADAPYDGFADAFAREAPVSPYNAHYDRPTVLGLLGDVNGVCILDGGCGPGPYLSELAARGADTVGIDQSADMVGASPASASVRSPRSGSMTSTSPSPGPPAPASTSSCSPWSSAMPTTASAP